LFPTFCCDAVTDVLESGDISVPFLNSPTVARLRMVRDRVEISSSVVDPMMLPKNELCEGLIACAERLAGLAEHIWPGDPDLQSFVEGARHSAAAARAKLAEPRRKR